jgi:hypothetical protein
MPVTASKMLKENQDPPTTQELLEGLSEKEVKVIFDLILLFRECRSQKPKTASQRMLRNDPDGIEDRLWLLVELIKSFMDLYDQDDEQLVSKCEGWFIGLDYEPTDRGPNQSFRNETWEMFEGLTVDQWTALTRLLSFIKQEQMLARFEKSKVKTKETG